jgi:hypothetical protein
VHDREPVRLEHDVSVGGAVRVAGQRVVGVAVDLEYRAQLFPQKVDDEPPAVGQIDTPVLFERRNAGAAKERRRSSLGGRPRSLPDFVDRLPQERTAALWPQSEFAREFPDRAVSR